MRAASFSAHFILGNIHSSKSLASDVIWKQQKKMMTLQLKVADGYLLNVMPTKIS